MVANTPTILWDCKVYGYYKVTILVSVGIIVEIVLKTKQNMKGYENCDIATYFWGMHGILLVYY